MAARPLAEPKQKKSRRTPAGGTVGQAANPGVIGKRSSHHKSKRRGRK